MSAPGVISALRVSDLLAELDRVEVWRPVDGYPGYQVSSWGRVKGPRTILAPSVAFGYERVSLSRDGEVRNRRVNRLVLVAFHGDPPFEGAICAHNDGASLNNRASNLRWATPKENQDDRIRHNTRIRGSDVAGAKLREADIPNIRERIATGMRFSDIADEFSVSISTISLIKLGRVWRHV